MEEEWRKLLNFPDIPVWWTKGVKFMKLQKPYEHPNFIVGYDTETCSGDIMTQQFYWSEYGKKQRNDLIEWVKGETVLNKFLKVMENFYGHVVCYCFNAKFDMAILLREYIGEFLNDDFTIRHTTDKNKTWQIDVRCSKNWYATFKRGNTLIYFLDIQNFFSGSLAKVAETFQCEAGKLEKPEGLGEVYFYQNDKQFVEYALMDARLCLEIGEKLLDMHEEFDIPLATSSANFAEKVFRRNFIKDGIKLQFPSDFPCLRLSELSYHGGKNGYYIDDPSYIHNCYEYDFNSAYPYAMYNLPTFVEGEYKRVEKFSQDYVGVYQVTGTISPCKFGILYNNDFNYYRFSEKVKVQCFASSFEIQEAINSKEFKMDSAKGYVWKPSKTTENPIKEYSRYFWEKKNATDKKDIRYIFYKLLLNSLYGKWIQRNPKTVAKYKFSKGKISVQNRHEIAGGLYHPFIASLITGSTRARLHQAEHHFNAIESSTDSVKSRIYDSKSDSVHEMGVMELQKHYCSDCAKPFKKVNGLFVRNRLNLLMCPKEHILKCALHGFWGKPKELLRMYHAREYIYQVDRMPLLREGLQQIGKNLFQMHEEERSINVSWDNLQVVR